MKVKKDFNSYLKAKTKIKPIPPDYQFDDDSLPDDIIENLRKCENVANKIDISPKRMKNNYDIVQYFGANQQFDLYFVLINTAKFDFEKEFWSDDAEGVISFCSKEEDISKMVNEFLLVLSKGDWNDDWFNY